MSGKITGEVLDRCLALKGVHKLLLISLADYCGAERDCWPSMKTIAKRSGCTERYARQVVSELEKLGYISIRPNQGPHRVNVYVLSPAETWDTLGLGDTEPQDTPEPEVEHPGTNVPLPRNPSSANPSSYPLEEPSSPVAVAPVASEPPVKKPRAAKKEPSATTTAENGIRREAERFFIEETGLKPPSDAKASSAAVRWWTPLRQICELGDWDAFKVNPLIQRTVRYMRANHLTISAPQSIVNVATALQAEASLRAREQAPVASSGDKPWWADGNSMKMPVQSRHSGRDDG